MALSIEHGSGEYPYLHENVHENVPKGHLNESTLPVAEIIDTIDIRVNQFQENTDTDLSPCIERKNSPHDWSRHMRIALWHSIHVL
jgi:hypothetical protein